MMPRAPKSETTAPDAARGAAVSPAWAGAAPLGILFGGALAGLRAVATSAAAGRRIGPDAAPQAAEIRAWGVASGFPEMLLEGLVAGLLATALAVRCAEPPHPEEGAQRGSPAALFAFCAALFTAVLSGWPFAAPALRGRPSLALAMDSLAVQAALAVLLTAALFALARRAPARPSAVRLAAAAGLAVLAPLALAWSLARPAPSFEQREVVHDFLAAGEGTGWRIVRGREDRAPHAATLSPYTAWETDSGDKPTLVMPPPASVELRVPTAEELAGGDATGLRLRAAAGVARHVVGRIPKGRDALAFEFAIDVDGDEVWRERVRVPRPVAGKWDPTPYVWHHAGGAEGLDVRPGSRVTLRTDLAPGEPLPEGFAGADLGLGFGGIVLERRERVPRTRATRERPNVVLIVMDTQRADRMSCYGWPRPTTPNVDRLAARGVLFEDAYATSSWTWPSTASILTGLGADAHGVTSNESCTLALGLDTLAEALQGRGFTTGGFSANPLIAAERYFDQGFEHFEAPRDAFLPSSEVVPRALQWLEAHAEARFLLYLHLADPHIPHRPHAEELARLGLVPPPDFPPDGMQLYHRELMAAPQNGSGPALDEIVPPEHQRWLSDLYDACVATGDRWTGVVLDRLAELGLEERTIVVFTSDHGEELFDHGSLEHGHSLHGELVRVPLILAGPGIASGRRVSGVVSNRHIAPTLAQVGAASLPDVRDPVSLALEGDAPRDVAVVQTEKGVWAGADRQRLYGLRRGAWFLHWRAGEPTDLSDFRLFDLSTDPDELVDLAPRELVRARAMWDELRGSLDEQTRARPRSTFGAGSATREMLDATGYGGGDDGGEER